jgi:hypothetical protein
MRFFFFFGRLRTAAVSATTAAAPVTAAATLVRVDVLAYADLTFPAPLAIDDLALPAPFDRDALAFFAAPSTFTAPLAFPVLRRADFFTADFFRAGMLDSVRSGLYSAAA